MRRRRRKRRRERGKEQGTSIAREDERKKWKKERNCKNSIEQKRLN